MSRVQEIIDSLSQRKASVVCNGKVGLLAFLEELGFSWTDGKSEGHKIFVHTGLSRDTGFTTFSIDCGHAPRRPMKLGYVVTTLRVLRKYKDQLDDYESFVH